MKYRKIEPEFYCACKDDCSKCPKPAVRRGKCVYPVSTECRQLSQPVVCPCLIIKRAGGEKT